MEMQTKRSIDYSVPFVIGAVVAFMSNRKGNPWQQTVALLLIAFVLAYILTTRVTKWLYENNTKTIRQYDPAEVDACKTFDPKPITDRIYRDIYTVFAARDIEAYNQLLALSFCQLRKVANDWNSRYKSKDNETLLQAIMNEAGSTWEYGVFTRQQQALQQKFQSAGIA